MMDVISNLVSLFWSLSPQVQFAAAMALGSISAYGGMSFINQMGMSDNKKLNDEIQKDLDNLKKMEKSLERSKGKKRATPIKTSDIEKEDYRTSDTKANIEFCHKLLSKNYIRYQNDPTTIDLTLEALSNKKLLAMLSLVNNVPDPVFQNIKSKAQTIVNSRSLGKGL